MEMNTGDRKARNMPENKKKIKKIYEDENI
jgi:hypothetical protein